VHYQRWRKTGDPLGMRRSFDPLTNFLAFIAKPDGEGGCWPWTGHVNQQGQGRWQPPGENQQMAHRLAYELFVGPIPDGLTIDHVCHSSDPGCPGGDACLHRRCVNPAHLEPVTITENIRRRDARNPRTHCKRGHPLSGDNLYLFTDSRGYTRRYCRTCRRDNERRRR
jgi:hypothetical protein